MTPLATVAQLADFEGITLGSEEFARLLRKAEREVRRMLTTASYATDADGNATDASVKTTLAEAVCAQIAYFRETGDTTGVAGQYSGGSIGDVSLPRGNVQVGDSAALLRSPEAGSILRSNPNITWTLGY